MSSNIYKIIMVIWNIICFTRLVIWSQSSVFIQIDLRGHKTISVDQASQHPWHYNSVIVFSLLLICKAMQWNQCYVLNVVSMAILWKKAVSNIGEDKHKKEKYNNCNGYICGTSSRLTISPAELLIMCFQVCWNSCVVGC